MSIKVPGGNITLCPIIEEEYERSKPHCVKQLNAYNECVKRIGPNPARGVSCEMQYFDYYRCLDHHV
jgi:hypothetical protein